MCSVSAALLVIRAECTYPTSSIIGFQMTAHTSNLSLAQKLYVNQSMKPQTIATVEVEEVEQTGVYLVSIMPIMEGIGIPTVGAEYYYQQVMRSDSCSGKYIYIAVPVQGY